MTETTDTQTTETTETTTESTELRRRLHGMWANVAPGWEAHADYVDVRGASITAELLALTVPQPGERFLELACGPGSVGLEAAALVGPTGAVVLSDVAPEMAAIAGARASARGLANVATAVLDVEDIAEPDRSFDVVVCREGLMFATDPARALREIARILRPQGRVAISVWGPKADNPWLAIVLDAVSAQVGMPVPPPGVPGPFSLDDAGALPALLTDAGLVDVGVSQMAVPLRTATFDEWWTRTVALAGPVATLLASLPQEARRQLRARVEAAAAPYATPDGAMAFPGTCLLASGATPSDRYMPIGR